MANYPYGYGNPSGQWGPPAGPPPGQWTPPSQSTRGIWNSQSGPPPGQWAPPPGPPQAQWAPPPGQPTGQWAPPTGPPPQTNDHSRPYPGHHGHGNPPTSYQQAYNQGGPPGAHFQPPQPTGGQPYFQYSNCTGRRKALCIGINYIGMTGELRGCHNDALNMQRFLIERYNYKQEDMVILLDAPGSNARQVPTRANIISAMHWLVANAQPNDSLFFHFSGHGGQTEDLDGDEDDGFDEVIYPLDHKKAGHIVDDDMFAIMVAPLPPGCRLTAIFDSCHSGTALDLPYVYSTEGKIKEPNLLAEAGQGALQAGLSYMRGDIGGMAKGLLGLGKKVMSGNKADQVSKATRTSPADAIQWSGCKDSQTSADAVEAGSATGAMSYAFISALTANPQQTYQQLLVSIRQILASKYSQKPQLSASHPIDTNLMFVM
ncbi:caspase domain-containing protein [Phakopsora pachyrhizi]|uniref:Caspase domain-domain-containing protein n=1 Tax=Phakopsora pachyrhizi TaxID=170000 RepID=A0AAV0BJW7_PHAPC|nr:caspase domain-containing protein [Phakopsora pachyrhizi]CAH7686615.1 caspase domain-domain-containing protein [Phakopsora pachyrhizi]